MRVVESQALKSGKFEHLVYQGLINLKTDYLPALAL
jgi:hypothetical protein